MKICIIGNGNISHALVGFLGNKNNVELSIYSTNKITSYFKDIAVFDDDKKLKTKGKVNRIVSNPKDVIPNSDIIIFAIPSFARRNYLKKISPFVKANTIIGSFPGSGGFNLEVEKYIHENITVFSSQRVPFIARIIDYGKSVSVSKKDSISVAIKGDRSNEVKDILESLLEMNIYILDTFLEINLSNSNPILHTSRLYSLFKNFNYDRPWSKNILFYEKWDLESSKQTLGMDDEFMKIVSKLNLKGIKPLREHYDVINEVELTSKLSSINAFKGIYTPMVKTSKGFIPDFDSRYFTEDISFGLVIIKWFAKKLNINTPNIDKVLNWYEKTNTKPSTSLNLDCFKEEELFS